jgi:hypothetical protein
MEHERQGTKTTIRWSEDIAAPADKVWAFVGDPQNDLVWQRSVLDVAGTPEDARSARKMIGRRVEAQGRLEVKPEERTTVFDGSYGTTEGPKHLRIQTTIEPAGDERCRVVGVVTVDTEIFGDGREHFEEVVRHEIEANHVNLRHIMEAHDDMHAGFAKLPSHG